MISTIAGITIIMNLPIDHSELYWHQARMLKNPTTSHFVSSSMASLKKINIYRTTPLGIGKA